MRPWMRGPETSPPSMGTTRRAPAAVTPISMGSPTRTVRSATCISSITTLLPLRQTLSAESHCRTSFRLGCLFFPILWRRGGFKRAKKTSRNRGDIADGSLEVTFVGLRRFGEAADFSHELERSSSNLFGRDGRIEVEEWFDIPAHRVCPKYQKLQWRRSPACEG